MAILVAGGAGYIGSHAVKQLLESGREVVVVDSLYTGNRWAVPEGLPFYELDILRTEELAEIMKKHKIDAVFHFCAYSLVGESVEKPLKYYKNNVVGAISLLEAMEKADVKRLIFSSTAAVYGNPQTDLLSENAELKPINPYGDSKMMMERIMECYAKASDLNYVALRYFNVAGASEDASIGEAHEPETHLIPLAMKRVIDGKTMYIYGDDYDSPDGTCIRDYIHIEDLIDAHILALIYLEKGGGSDVFNLGYSHGYSVKEILRAIQDVLKIEMNIEIAERRQGDPDVLVADASKIKRKLGFEAKRDNLELIIKSAYKWHSKRL